MIEGKKWLDSHVPSLKGKRVLLTGGTSGLGFQAARQLLYKGSNLTIACRSETKAERCKEILLKEFPNAELFFVFYDQARPESIQSLVKALEGQEFFSIVLNAGVFNPPKALSVCPDGTSLTFMTNAVGTYLLFKGLAKSHPSSRYVFVSSLVSRYPLKGDYSAFLGKNPRGAFLKYGVSKRAVMAIYENAFEKTALDVSIMSPGIARTEIIRGYQRWFQRLAAGFMSLFFHPAWKGALGITYLASGEGPRGAYAAPDDWFRIDGFPHLYPPPHKKSAKGAQELIDLLHKTYGV